MALWVEAEVARLAGLRLRQKLAVGSPGPEGSATKPTFARVAQQLSALEVELLAEKRLRYDDWTLRRPDLVEFTGRDAGRRYLRAKGNSIEGRDLGDPPQFRRRTRPQTARRTRTDKDLPWKDVPR